MTIHKNAPPSPEQLAVNFKRSTGCFVLVGALVLCLISACGLVITLSGAVNWDPPAASTRANVASGEEKSSGESTEEAEQLSTPSAQAITRTQSATVTLPAATDASPELTSTQPTTSTQRSEPPVLVKDIPASFVAIQQFFTLALLAGIAILFPATLLYAFALQQMPRLSKELEEDLRKLGFFYHSGIYPISILDSDGYPTGGTSPGDTPLSPQEIRSLESAESVENIPSDLKQRLSENNRYVWTQTQEVKEQRWERVRERYGSWEFLTPVTVLTLFLLATIAWAFWPQGTYLFGGHFVTSGGTLHTYFWNTIAAMPAALVAMLTAYLFVTYGLVRRYHRSDITPGAFWDAFKRLFVVFLIGLALTVLFKAEPSPPTDDRFAAAWTFGAILIGIFAGVFPVHTLQLLSKNGQAWLEQRFNKKLKDTDPQPCEDHLAQRLRPRHDLTLLDDMDAWDIERIEQEGIIGVQGMATANMVDLVTWTPFPTTQIVDWMDQAILWMAAGAEPCRSYVGTLRAIGLRGASDLIDATKDPEGKLRVVLAAQTVRGAMVEDPIPSAQLAGLRAQLKVKDARQKVDEVKAKQKDESTDGVAAALEAVRVARWLVNDASDQVKNGGDALKDALEAATDLKPAFNTVSAKADEVEKSLKAVTDSKVSDELATALQALRQAYTEDVVARADALAKALDRIAQPLLEVEQKAKEFQILADTIEQAARKKQGERDGQPNPPGEVNQAADRLAKLKESTEAAKDRIKADAVLGASAVDDVDELLKLLADTGTDKPQILLSDDRLKKESQWTEYGNDQMAKAHADAQKLVEAAKQIVTLIDAGNTTIKKSRAAATFPSSTPPLTVEILETILCGLENNPNLRRIQRYLREATGEVPPSWSRHCSNVEWLRQGNEPCTPLAPRPNEPVTLKAAEQAQVVSKPSAKEAVPESQGVAQTEESSEDQSEQEVREAVNRSQK